MRYEVGFGTFVSCLGFQPFHDVGYGARSGRKLGLNRRAIIEQTENGVIIRPTDQ